MPSHCALMQPAANRLAEKLKHIAISTPSIPVIQNADVKSFTNADDIRAALILQLTAPVRWVETIQWMIANGVTHFYECGPGKVLCGLNKRISRDVECESAV